MEFVMIPQTHAPSDIIKTQLPVHVNPAKLNNTAPPAIV